MGQSLLCLTLTDAQLADIDGALSVLETTLSGLIALTPDQRRALTKMGPKSESFCRQTLTVLGESPQVIPPSVDLKEAQSDLAALDRLRPCLARLQRLAERAEDTDVALGSDVITLALEGYAVLKVAGRNQSLEGLRKELSVRFSRGGARGSTS
ncbi:MAG: hypothetical protein ACTHOH_16725 [Lysobacteraceae bacterium]